MANDLNQCQFIGRLGADPETRVMQSGEAVSNFRIAVGSKWKNKTGEQQESTEWVTVTAFGKIGEICAQYLKKGSQVYISGRMKTEKYDKNGVDHYATKIIAENMQMLGGKSEAAKDEQPKPQPKPASFDSFDDDIPF